MSNSKRIVILGRDASSLDSLTRILEGAGYIVASTTNDGVAIDMVGSSSYDALLIGRDVAEADRRYVATESRNRDVGIVVLTVNSLRSVLTQLSQALP
jgi:CheY-like chemotaxis protein